MAAFDISQRRAMGSPEKNGKKFQANSFDPRRSSEGGTNELGSYSNKCCLKHVTAALDAVSNPSR